MSFETIIGLEIHAELKTKTKIFCNCSTKFGSEPNENTCPVCLGMPGTLPVLNEEVVRLASKAGTALNSTINKLNKMDRKNYFYPDLPKAYQISQFDLPICSGGYIDINSNGEVKRINLNRIHIEEDAGKLVHVEYEPYTLIDYNRVGVPLIEIVTEPDLRSIDDAVSFLKNLKEILEYADISDCRMEQGSLRCDANISLREVGSNKLNTRVEIKNLNSFKELQKALEKEEKRQRELYTYGEEHKIVQETRRWDSAKGKTVSMRSKEESHDYRYFPEPDVIPIVIKDEIIEGVIKDIPELPKEKRVRFTQVYKLGEKEVEILVGDKSLSMYYEELIEKGSDAKIACNWVLSDILRVINEKKITIDDFSIRPDRMHRLLTFVESGKINNTAAKEVFEEMLTSHKVPEDLIKEKGLLQTNSIDDIRPIVEEVLKQNSKVVEEYKGGKTQVKGFLVGMIVKATEKKANPKVINEILEEILNNI
jgi:aspartyl-tRNA(Asn)/glutamyl-tRNA(Gln) amidotransferase subunit B